MYRGSPSPRRKHIKIESPYRQRLSIFNRQEHKSPRNPKSSRSFAEFINSRQNGFIVDYDDRNNNRDACYNCKSRNVSYTAIRNKKYYCPQCAAEQMGYGTQMAQIDDYYHHTTHQLPKAKSSRNLHFHDRFEKYDRFDKYEKFPRYQQRFHDRFYQKRNQQLQQAFDYFDSYENKIKRWLYQTRNHESDMKKFFKSTKQYLKQYYEGINEILSKAWKADIQVLQTLQKKEGEIYKQNKKTIEQQLMHLNKIKLELQPNIDAILDNNEQFKFASFMNNYIHNMTRVGQWIKQDLKKKPQEIFIVNKNPKLIEQKTYKLINDKIQLQTHKNKDKSKKSVLFSFTFR